jgi:transcriptional regulator GlxA family with amidase domain
VAAAAGLGYESWRKRFAAETGQPPGRYRARRRVDAAAELLRRSSLTNREIAEAVGFSDEHHFARQFRAVTGLSTTAYRRTVG